MKKAAINISIDDISPHPLSSIRVLDNCNQLIEKFPKVKISLFIPTSYWRTILNDNDEIDTRSDEPYDIRDYPDFCNVLRALPDKNFELGYHGLHHGIPGESNNDEFRYLTHRESIEKFREMMKPAEDMGLKSKFERIFRPPAWKMSPDAIQASLFCGIDYLSLSPERQIRREYKNENKRHTGVTYYNVSPPWKPLELYFKTTIVYHACEWSTNYLGEDSLLELEEFLKEHENKYFFGFTRNMVQKLNRAEYEYEHYLQRYYRR